MRYTPLLLCAVIAAPTAYADIQFNGFLSAIGGTATDDPIRQYEDDITFRQDSIFGLQARADVSEKLSVTGQLVSRGEDDFATELAWGYLAYEATQSLTLRMGRFRTPFYFYSDFLEVGYAYPWISPADEVYSLQFDNIDGIDLLYKITLFDTVSADFQAYFGAIDDEFILNNSGEALDAQTRNNVGLSATFGIGDFSLRASAHNAKTTVHNFDDVALPAPIGSIGALKNILEGQAQAAPALATATNKIIANLAIDEVDTSYTQLGLKYDGQYGFAVAEVTNLDFDTGPAADQQRFFVSAGVNIGSATLFASYAEAEDDQVDLSQPLNAVNVGGGFDPIIAVLDGVSEALSVTSETTSFGIRYDFEPGAAFKLQFDNIEIPDATNPSKTKSQSLVRFGVDLVF